jgi:hypothetical protein
MGERRIALDAFEDQVVAYLATNYRFPESLVGSMLDLVPNRHLFVEDMPTVDELREDSEREGQYDYDENQPTLSLYNESDPNLRGTISFDSKIEFLTRFVIRFGVVSADTKQLARDLYVWSILQLKGKTVGKYLVKNVIPSSGPVAIEVADDSHAFATFMLRFQVVVSQP